MRKISFCLYPAILLFAFTYSCKAQQKQEAALPVIFDTDIGPDYDDVGAMALLHAMADSGECKILATIASNKHERIAAVLRSEERRVGKECRL